MKRPDPFDLELHVFRLSLARDLAQPFRTWTGSTGLSRIDVVAGGASTRVRLEVRRRGRVLGIVEQDLGGLAQSVRYYETTDVPHRQTAARELFRFADLDVGAFDHVAHLPAAAATGEPARYLELTDRKRCRAVVLPGATETEFHDALADDVEDLRELLDPEGDT